MNRNISKMLAAFALTTAATYVTAAPVECSRPAQGNGEVQACRAASQSVDELRRFIQRTQGIYILYMEDFAASIRG